MSRPVFKILKKSKKSRARLGMIKTKHGVLRTPAFFPVATQGAVKTLDSQDIKNLGYEGALANTYHLMLRPGSEKIKKLGGLHEFMGFDGVIATDSGGFQVFSLGKGLEHGVGKITKSQCLEVGLLNIGKKPSLVHPVKSRKAGISPSAKLFDRVKIREEGVWFQSHIDGSEQFLNPEKSIKIQQDLGADIIFAFDECTSPLDDFDYTKKSMERTHRWAKRCLKQHLQYLKTGKDKNGTISCDRRKLSQKLGDEKTKNTDNQALFGIVQGGLFKNLRQESAKFIGELPFDGFGIGGSLGVDTDKTKKTMYDILDWTIPLLPAEKPRHLLGIGYLEDLEKSIKKGIDLFDCVYPTRLARHGIAFVAKSTNKSLLKSDFNRLNIRQARHLKDKKPLDENCQCPACQNYSRAYISHLLRANEITAMRLLTLHNLWFFKQFIDSIREKIANNQI